MSDVKTLRKTDLAALVKVLNTTRVPVTLEGELKYVSKDERARTGEEAFTGMEKNVFVPPGSKHERVLYEGTFTIKPSVMRMLQVSHENNSTSVTPVGEAKWKRAGSNGDERLELSTVQYGILRLYL